MKKVNDSPVAVIFGLLCPVKVVQGTKGSLTNKSTNNLLNIYISLNFRIIEYI